MFCRFAQVGFVNGSSSYIFSESGTANITGINSTSNIDCPGVWLFRVNNFLPASESYIVHAYERV